MKHSASRHTPVVLAAALVLAGLGSPPAARAQSAPKSPPRASKPAGKFLDGKPLEVKWGGLWRQATVVRRVGKLYLVNYENQPEFHNEWVTADRLRPKGSKAKGPDYARPNQPVANGTPEEALHRTAKSLGLSIDTDDAAEAAGQSPPEVADAEPEAAEPEGAAPEGAAPEGAAPLDETPAVAAEGEPAEADAASGDRSDVRDVTSDAVIAAASDLWVYAPPADAPTPRVAARPVALAGSTKTFFDSVEAVAVAPPASGGGPVVAVVAHVDGAPGASNPVRVERVDLTAGRPGGWVEVPAGTRPLAAAPGGTRFAAVESAGPGAGKRDTVVLWDAATKPPKRTAEWRPFDEKDWTGRDVEWAEFTAPDRLLTLSRDGELTSWSLPAAGSAKAPDGADGADAPPAVPTAVWTVSGSGGFTGRPAVSADRRAVAVAVQDRLTLLSADDGAPLGVLPGTISGGAALALRPDGKRLATVGSDLTVWKLDAPAPEPLVAVAVPNGVAPQASAAWVDDDFLLVGGRHLVDARTGLVVWAYEPANPNAPQAVAGGRAVYPVTTGNAGRDRVVILAAADLPHPEARKAAGAIDPAAAFAVGPGTPVALDLSLGEYEPNRPAIEAALTARAEAAGLVVDPAAPTKLAAAVTPGESHTVSYRLIPFGGFPQDVAATIADQNLTLSLVSGGATLWQRQTRNSYPSSVHLERGQTIEQYVAKQRETSWKFFEAIDLPSRIQRPIDGTGGGEPIGRSQLTAAGPKPAKP